jgi:uncharacterized damage-inducible protein DinB
MSIGQQLLAEFEQEMQATRRVLERLPEDQFSWRAHPTSMSLGQLALHVAATPGGVTQMIQTDTMEIPQFGEQPEAAGRAEVMAALDQSTLAMRHTLSTADDGWLMTPWVMTNQGKEVLRVPRVAMLRSVGMNHIYHHRGQLAMCLRMLGVPVPSVYGASRDENPFLRA